MTHEIHKRNDLFSDRYNGKHDRFYERYEAICRTVPNMAPMPRPEPIRSIKAFRTRVSNRKSNTSFHYGSGSPNTDWLQSDDIPIVTRRELEEKTGQLMALQPIDGGTEFSHTIWKMERPGQRRRVKKSKDGVKIGYIQVLTKGEKGDTGKENESHQANVQRRSEKTKAQLPCSDKENRTAEVSFVCPQPECHMPFANRAGLRSHQRDNGHHNWQYQCVDCSMYFRQVNYLNRHRTVCRQPRPANAQTNIRQ
ncbi:uncharacterized protein LOC111070419 isoform X2 [Drosophila obscura]|uniref:uncharacterized protein LOC111070419 isoform X2 n=1 Tax=Drosophila obscura TaxID=7282 RepID=UPI000BA13F50|nr:uncharacterized protein LOC111070419 isoform X2 [Drosophila obscura]